jgi:hypothetical protein
MLLAAVIAVAAAAVQVRDLAGKSYRLLKDNLDKDIMPNESKFVVKKVSMCIYFTFSILGLYAHIIHTAAVVHTL